MKFKRYILFTAVLLGVTAVSCNKVLDLEPKGVTLSDDALKNEEDLKNLLNSCYTVIASDNFYGGRVQVLNELLADQLDGGLLTGDFGEIYGRKTSIFGDYKNNYYREPYIAVYRANTVLANIGLASGTAKENIEGQAKFIRALCEFEIVKLFAQPYGYTADNSHLGVPIKLDPQPSNSVRASVQQVYDQILKDLQEAEVLLPDVNGNYPTKWSAKGLLARVYFQMNNFAKAYEYADQVIESGKFTFDSDYSKRYSEQGTPEAVYKLVNEVSKNRFNEIRTQFKSDVSIPTLKIDPTFAATATSDPNDVRKAWYDKTTYSGWVVITKYNKNAFQMPVILLTELKLVRAESAGELNDPAKLTKGISDLNDILNRAYAGTRSIPVNSAASLVISTAREQRGYELVAEGDRLSQIKRIGASGENIVTRNAPWNCPGMVLQFPQGEIANSSGFEKNPEGGCY